MELAAIVERCTELYEDLDLASVARWKSAAPGRVAVGYLPVWAPREILHACGVLPVGILGAGEELEIVRGDACFQSYICHIPRSVVELGLSGRLDCLDGMLFPSTCDVLRNLSGVWKLLFPGRYVRYLDLPQEFSAEIGGAFLGAMLRDLQADMQRLSGERASEDDLRRSIHVYDENRALVRRLQALRAAEPWRVPTSECYLVLRAGCVLPVEEHSALVFEYLAAVQDADRRVRDDARVLLQGAFCEQPPLGLIRTLERAGCTLVDDDFLPILRWARADVPRRADPIEALCAALLEQGAAGASRFVPDGSAKGQELIEAVRASRAEGVIFAAPSFCDPALLDRPMLQRALDQAGIHHTEFQYAENTGQMQPIREQAGAFADAIKLWGEGVPA